MGYPVEKRQGNTSGLTSSRDRESIGAQGGEAPGQMITLHAPAKVNLTLEVLGKRPDGYHEIRSLMQAIDLCDTLTVEPAQHIDIVCPALDLPVENNLVTRAARLLAEATGCRKGARITVEKRIPAAGGLGGGSSDAAAALLGLNRLWSLGLSLARLADMASLLGSDVPFFVYGGTALAEGRGEKVTPVEGMSRHWLVLLSPPIPGLEKKTAKLYRALLPASFTGGEATTRAIALLAERKPLKPGDLFNVFDGAARTVFPGLAQYWERAEHTGGEKMHLAGSGPILFAWLPDKGTAEKVHSGFVGSGLTAYLASTT